MVPPLLAQVVDLSPWVTLVAPQFALAVLVAVAWAKGVLVSKPVVDKMEAQHKAAIDALHKAHDKVVRQLKDAHDSHVASIVATYEDRLDDHEKLLDRAASDIGEAEQERRDAQALALRLAGVAESVVTGSGG